MTGPGAAPAFVSEAFDPTRHSTAGFACGEPELDEWLREHAEHAGRMNTARTFVWVRSGRGAQPVLGYYALSAHLVASDDAPRSIARGGPRQIPAILLSKLALSTQLHGQGLGAQLLVDALRRAVGASREGAAARVMVVDALHDGAARFYAKYGFAAVRDNPRRLVRKVSDIEAAVRP